MKITQAYEYVNAATRQVLGQDAVVNEDLSNIVDIGKDVLSTEERTTAWMGNILDKIGRTIFVDRIYKGQFPKILMDSWEFGSIVEKIREELPQASVNESWDLKDGESYDPNIYYGAKLHAKLFNKIVTFELDRSIPEVQIKQAFTSPTAMVSFLSMRQTVADNAMTIKLENLIRATHNNAVAEVIHASIPDGDYANTSTAQAVNLLYLYKQANPNSTLTAKQAMTDKEFLRFANRTIDMTRKNLEVASTVFNVGKTEKFTPEDRAHLVVLNEFASASTYYLESDTFHDNLVKLPGYDAVSFWQGSGTSFAFEDVSTIDVKTTSNDVIKITGVIATLFDRDAMAVTNMNRRTKSHYNSKAEFFNYFHKMDAGYLNDLDENIVVFYVA